MPFQSGEWYRCRVEPKVVYDESNKAKTPYIGVTFLVVAGEMAGETLAAQLYATEKNRENVMGTLQCLGFTGGTFEDLEKTIVGKTVEVEARESVFKGKSYGYRAGRVRTPRTPEGAGQLQKKIASVLGMNVTPIGPRVAAAAAVAVGGGGAVAVAPESDDEVPF